MSEKVLSILDDDYQRWISSLKKRYRQSQIKAAVAVNHELILFYWSLGRDIVLMKGEARWGKGFIDSLSRDLRKEFNEAKGFSPRNLRSMRQFYELFPESLFWKQVVSEFACLPWGHIVLLLKKVKGDAEKARFYAQKIIENGWSLSIIALTSLIIPRALGRARKAARTVHGKSPERIPTIIRA